MKTTKKKMTVLAIVIAIAAILLLPNWQTDAAANEGWFFRGERTGCKIQGSWYQIGPRGAFMMQFNGSGANGTYLAHWQEADPTLGGIFPDAVSFSDSYGVWVRTGGNTFKLTLQGFALDGGLGGASKIVYFVRNTGTATLSDDCNTIEFKYNVMEILLPPNMDPFEFGRDCVPPVLQIEHPARRITLEEICEE